MNPYIRNSNFAKQTYLTSTVFEGSGLGAGISFVSEKLRETNMEYFFFNDDSIKWMGYFNFNYNWQFFKSLNFPLLTIFGFNSHFWPYTSHIDGKKSIIMFNIPVGFRYNLELADGLIVSPVFRYNLGLNSVLSQSNTYWTAGVDARYKIFQGGISINSGDLIKYLGIRAGFAF